MIDTNSLSQLASHTLGPRPFIAPEHSEGGSTLNTLNAWHIVALGAGAYLAHAYHSIKAAGGIKTILKCLWSGAPAPNAEGRMQNEETGQENQEARQSYIVNRKSPSPAEQALGAPIPSPDTRHSSPL